ncbi:cytochrome P450 27C1 isoform X1 [Mustela erminea]|uniref:cytochrome P450 27C1 isoform X1 n=1 Tax=Mustela erminea TaxID=36723 RepID=UPI0013875D6A|nr:cytochrome P450 27C1 isoform X1 [Mustela erminea]
MPRRYEFEEALLEHVEAEQRATPKDNSSPNKKNCFEQPTHPNGCNGSAGANPESPCEPGARAGRVPGRRGPAAVPARGRPAAGGGAGRGQRSGTAGSAAGRGPGRGTPQPRRHAGAPHARQPGGVLLEGRLQPHPRDPDRDMVAQVLRAEGAAPQRANMGSWQEYRHLRGRSTGLISAEGEQWLKMRRVLRQRILKPRDVAIFSSEINQVIADLIKRIYVLKSQAEDGETVTNVNDLFFKYSMEGVATILYESRLGCLEDSIPQDTVDYIEALGLMFSMFKTSMYAGVIPRWLRPFIPKPWREFCRSWDGLFRFSQIHVDNKLKDIQSHMDSGESVRGGLLTCLFLSQELTLEEIYANMTEMLLAGVDTTSFTLSWAVYLLARHPEVQQTVYQEILKNLGDRHVPTAADVPKVPLVRALLKETLRLFPVLPGNGRVTQEDLVIGGYLIPKGTQLALCQYATSYADENFPRAKEFRPERWLRKGRLDRVDNFGSIPFGYGVRSCIGRRIAELEIHLLVIQLLQHFEIKTSSWTKAVPAKTHGLLTPGGPIHVRFVNRK